MYHLYSECIHLYNHLYSLYHLYPQRSKNLIYFSMTMAGLRKKILSRVGFPFCFCFSTCTAGHRRSWKAGFFRWKRRWIFGWLASPLEKYLNGIFQVFWVFMGHWYKYLVWLAIPWKITHFHSFEESVLLWFLANLDPQSEIHLTKPEYPHLQLHRFLAVTARLKKRSRSRKKWLGMLKQCS